MSYSPRVVANALLRRAKERGVKLTHMKLQKLVFFMHAWSLALNDKLLLKEKPAAWPYGPVFDTLYHDLKSFGSNPIDSLLTELNPVTGNVTAMVPSPTDGSFWKLLDSVWDRYSVFSAMQLSALTHEAGGPWDKARRGQTGDIPDDWIKSHYKAKLNAQSSA